MIATSLALASGASFGMNTYASMPALAAYADMAPAALPADGMVSLVRPSSLALETAADRPRALNEPVGLAPSSLMNSDFAPVSRPRRSAGSIGVNPSPSVTTFELSRTGISSKYRHMSAGLVTKASRSTSRRAAPRSYLGYSTFPHSEHVRCGRSGEWVAPQQVHSR